MPATIPLRTSFTVGHAMFREMARTRGDAMATAKILRRYLDGPSRDEALSFLGAYLSRTLDGAIPDPELLEP